VFEGDTADLEVEVGADMLLVDGADVTLVADAGDLDCDGMEDILDVGAG
jgi:hypothetical protein